MSEPDAPNDGGNDAGLIETRIDGESVFDGKLLHVRRDRVRLPDGHDAMREYIVHPGAVMMLARQDDGRYVMVRQFRYPLARVFVEFPAGKIDAGEAPLATARRELVEEVGYTATHWRRVGVIHPVISYSTEAIEIWHADGLQHVGRRLDEGEFLQPISRSVDELLAAFDRGEITDAKTVTGMFMLDRQRRR
ncbi:MAG: NUDIX hydrolase [Casimicrobiaceae bacterium]